MPSTPTKPNIIPIRRELTRGTDLMQIRIAEAIEAKGGQVTYPDDAFDRIVAGSEYLNQHRRTVAEVLADNGREHSIFAALLAPFRPRGQS